MKGKYRRKSRAEAQRELVFEQKNFQGGENSDTPASDIGEKEVALLENAIAFPEYIEGRGGSQRFSDTALPGSGAVNGRYQHPKSKKHLLFRGGSAYLADAAMTAWTTVACYATSTSPTVNGDTGSQLGGLGLFNATTSNTNAGTLYWEITNSGTTRTINLYKDSGKTQLVARAQRTGDGPANFIPQNNSGLYGWTTGLTYTGDDTDAGNTLTDLVQAFDFFYDPDADRVVARELDADFLVFRSNAADESSIFHIDAEDSKWRSLNYPQPNDPIVGSGSQGGGTPYGYRYLYSFSRIENDSGVGDTSKNRISGTLVHETACNRIRNDETNDATAEYGEFWVANPISPSNPNAVTLTFDGTTNQVVLGADAHPEYTAHTHISLYRTLDIGVNGLDPVSGNGNNPEIYVWVGDYAIGSASAADEKTDADLRAAFYAGFGLKTRFWSNIPSACDVGEVAGTFLYAAETGGNDLYYCQLVNKQHIGYYSPTNQFFKLDNSIQHIKASPDVLVILCSGKTYISSPNSYVNAGLIESVFVLNHMAVADESIGVSDYGTIAAIDSGSFVARCSDHSVRVWGGTSWGRDLSSRAVNKIVRRMALGATGAYFAGAYYLWYREDSSQLYNNLCLRLGFGRDNGFGWSRVAGASWVYPPLYCGAGPILDANGIQRLIVMDFSGSAFYWTETFDGYAGSSLSKVWLDKVATNGSGGVAITSRVRFKEITGTRESDTCYHEETHAYVRPVDESVGYISGFQVNIIGYANGAPTPVETVTDVPKDGDVQFWAAIEGRRIQTELNFVGSQWRLVGVDTHYQAQDKAAIGKRPADTDEAGYQLALASDLKHWLTRGNNRMNRATGTNYTLAGTAPTNTTGPDGKSYGLSFVSGASYTQADATSYSNFAIQFWVKNFTVGNRVLVITGSSSFYLEFTSNTTLNVNGDGTATVSSIASGWHHFAVVRSGSTVRVYQNGGDTLAIVTVSGARGGTSVTWNPDGAAMELYDLRIQNAAISQADAEYLYNDVSGNSGEKVLPRV